MLDALGNIGDFLGGIGVVITLIYLAFQIRQNTAQLRSDAEQRRLSSVDEVTRGLADWQSDVVASAEVADPWIRGIKGEEELRGAERLRFQYHGARILQMWQANYFRYLHTQDSDNWSANAHHIRMFMVGRVFVPTGTARSTCTTIASRTRSNVLLLRRPPSSKVLNSYVGTARFNRVW